MKKKLLFTIDSLACAGAEKSLVTLLGLLDYQKYDVDLMLFSHGHELEELLPPEVRILPPLNYSEYASKSFKDSVRNIQSKKELKFLHARFSYSIKLRSQRAGNIKKSRLYWQSVRNVIDVLPDEYDVAIAYAQGVPTLFTAEKVKAAKKLAWVNASYNLNSTERNYLKEFYKRIDTIVTVSESSREVFNKSFPELKNNTTVIYDINNPKMIGDLSENQKVFYDDFKGYRILTIGRLVKIKGYDLALKACQILKESGLNFKWYVIGGGALYQELEEQIKQMNLENHFILLGVKANPYPYLKSADLYVQTSRSEGFGLAIAEARMLNVPVVTTEFDAVYDQMVQMKNGLVVQMNGEAVAEGILKMLHDEEMYARIKHYLIQEKKGNVEEIEKFYQLI